MTAPAQRITERGWQATVVDAARVHGWRVQHQYDSRRSQHGWPDLVLWNVRKGRIMYRELKTDKGRLSADQQRTLDELAACGADTGVWRPADWDRVLLELGAP